MSTNQGIDLLHPPSVPRRTVFLETADSQFHMQRRCALMQRQKWMREHGEWQKPLYGTAAVKENYRLGIRSTLKSQMEDGDYKRKQEWINALNESIMVSEKDRRDCLEDAEKRRNRFKFLLGYTQANKQIFARYHPMVVTLDHGCVDPRRLVKVKQWVGQLWSPLTYESLINNILVLDKMMESRWEERKQAKLLENKRDSEQLRYNPINWSHTLK